jgi:hypothetical protein
MDFLSDFSKTWSDPQMRHAMIVHWPIVLSFVCMLLSLGLVCTRAKTVTLKVITLAACVMLTGSGWMGLNSGERAENATGQLSEAAHDLLEEHEELGEKVPLLAAICAGLVLITFIPYPAIRMGAAITALLASGGTAIWIANTAHHGGRLVYEHGVGTPEVSGFSAPAANPDSASTQIGPPIDADDPRLAFFRDEVEPILAASCQTCHNPKRARKSGGLDQTSHERLLRGGRTGPAIVPGKPEASLMIQRVRGVDPDEDVMPPPPDPPLTADQVATLEQWIRDGAVWAQRDRLTMNQ